MGLKLPAAIVGLMMAGLGSWTAHAAGSNDGNREATLASSMKVSLTQAIATAEQHTGGKAFDAGVDGEDGKGRIGPAGRVTPASAYEPPPSPPADLDTRTPHVIRLRTNSVLHRFYPARLDPIFFDRSLGGRLNAPDGSYGVL